MTRNAIKEVLILIKVQPPFFKFAGTIPVLAVTLLCTFDI